MIKFKYDFTRDGWRLIENVQFHGIRFTPIAIEFLKKGELSVGGIEMKRRAKNELNANLGQHHMEYLLEHQEDLIPKRWQSDYFSLLFPGTVWETNNYNKYIISMQWNGIRWHPVPEWLELSFHPRERLVRSL